MNCRTPTEQSGLATAARNRHACACGSTEWTFLFSCSSRLPLNVDAIVQSRTQLRLRRTYLSEGYEKPMQLGRLYRECEFV